jgi:hypothetical protein
VTSFARREHSRISFSAAGPQIQTSGRTYEILDLSSRGVRFRTPGRAAPVHVGEPIRAIIQFRPDKAVEVRGKVLRVMHGQVAAKLDTGIPLQTILEERYYPPRPRRGMAW